MGRDLPADDEPASKRPRLTDPDDEKEEEYYVEQHLVGWIIGRGGSTLKEIEHTYGVKISVDQSTKGDGYSKVQIGGDSSLIQLAVEHMNASLARATAGPDAVGGNPGAVLLHSPPGKCDDSMYEDMDIKQRFVGWLLGRAGAVIREVEQTSGCKISINQDTRHQGFSRAQLHGRSDQRAHAKSLIETSLERAMASENGVRDVDEELQIEQRWVGWLLGRGGSVVKEIEEETGARLSVDQSTKHQGYSTVRVSGDRSTATYARELIGAWLQRVGGSPLADSDGTTSAQVEVDQQWVGWLLGKGGAVVREIEEKTGAKVSINQDTKDQGFSIAVITGRHSQVAQACDLIGEKLNRVGAGSPESLDTALVANTKPILPRMSVPQNQASPRMSVPQIQGSNRDPTLTLLEQMVAAVNGRSSPGGGGGVPKPASVRRLSIAPSGAAPPPSSLPPLKAPASTGRRSDQAALGEATEEMHVEQRYVGWLLGRGGRTLREIEEQTGARVEIDQTTKDTGFSIVRATGHQVDVREARRRVLASLSLVAPTAGGAGDSGEPLVDGEGDMQVDQKWVGWILGKSGVVLREIEEQSGCKIVIDQSTRSSGFSTIRFSGGSRESALARSMVQEKISQATSASVEPADPALTTTFLS